MLESSRITSRIPLGNKTHKPALENVLKNHFYNRKKDTISSELLQQAATGVTQFQMII